MMKTLNRILPLLVVTAMAVSAGHCGKKGGGGGTVPPPNTGKQFVNPLLSGSDPWVIKKDGSYYYTHTLGNKVAVWKTATMSTLAMATRKDIFIPAAATPNSANIWAPEFHFLNNKWYCYYTAGSGPDVTQRLWVLENSNADPTGGTWTDKGKIFATDSDFWAIDGTVLEHNGQQYFLWSGRPNQAVQNQNIYIAKMTNPWTLETPTVMLTKPELPWEVHGGPVNEGPQLLKNAQGKTFLIYSASGCWTDDYALGMLTLKDGGNPLVAADWMKQQQPVFTKNTANMAYGPGHNAFFTSPDNKEHWIIYHANNNSGDGCSGKRNIRMQSFTFNTDGTPNFGIPITPGMLVNVPSGE